VKTHRDLNLWKESIHFVTDIYTITKTFPKTEIFGIVNQLRRASVSVPSNISEGAARQSQKEFIQFLYIALGSLAEIESQLVISKNLEYLNKKQYEELIEKLNKIQRMLFGLIKKIKCTIQK